MKSQKAHRLLGPILLQAVKISAKDVYLPTTNALVAGLTSNVGTVNRKGISPEIAPFLLHIEPR
jgi:hypothetical protein